jgi:hypothetical protein
MGKCTACAATRFLGGEATRWTIPFRQGDPSSFNLIRRRGLRNDASLNAVKASRVQDQARAPTEPEPGRWFPLDPA